MRKCPVVNFDHHGREYAADKFRVLRTVREEAPVAWTEAWGGFWVVTGYEEMRTVALDDETYASLQEYDKDSIFQGQAIPPIASEKYRQVPLSLDPPEFFDFRRVFMGLLTPKVAESKTERFRQMVDYCIDQHIETGKIDLVLDIAAAVPAIVTMEILGLPLDDWEEYAEPVHAWVYTPPDSPDRARADAGFDGLLNLIRETIEKRKVSPGSDIISALTQATVRDGEPMTDQELLEMASIVVTGGVDTTTTLLANAFHYLDSHPEHRARLLADADFMKSATEEFLRFYTPVGALARTVTKDTELGGRQLERGDRVLISWAGANHDGKEFDRPDEIVLDRFPNRHCSFGIGIHRCLGSNFARAEFKIVMEQVLTRLPDYRIIHEEAEPYPSQISPGWIKMPAVFTPGKSFGTKL